MAKRSRVLHLPGAAQGQVDGDVVPPAPHPRSRAERNDDPPGTWGSRDPRILIGSTNRVDGGAHGRTHIHTGTRKPATVFRWRPPPAAVRPTRSAAACCRQKLRLLRQRASDAHALTVPFADQQEATQLKHAAELEVSRLTGHRSEGGYELPDDDGRAIRAREALAKASDDLRRLKERDKERTAAWQAASQALAACEEWFKNGRPGGTALEDFEGPKPTLNKNENLLDGIERHRRRVRELKADLHRIASAPFPSAHAKQRAREQIEALAMQGAPSVSALVELDGKIEFQTQRVRSEVHGEQRALAFHEAVDVVGLFAWLHRDALIAALDREITSEADDGAALTHEQRQRAEAEVMGDLLDIERQETALVFAAQAQGLQIEHRADINPVALLGLVLVTASRATNGHSSPEREGFNLIGRGQ
jgi:hypothetical protein